MSDNGPQFFSEEAAQFKKPIAIKLTFVAPYHPASNWAAERAV